MNREDRISFLKESCKAHESQIEAHRKIADGNDKGEARKAAGAMNDAEMALRSLQHELKQLTTGR